MRGQVLGKGRAESEGTAGGCGGRAGIPRPAAQTPAAGKCRGTAAASRAPHSAPHRQHPNARCLPAWGFVEGFARKAS